MGLSTVTSIVDARVAGTVRGPELPRSPSAREKPDFAARIAHSIGEIGRFVLDNPLVATAAAAIPGGLVGLGARKLGADLPLSIAAGTVLGAASCIAAAKVDAYNQEIHVETKPIKRPTSTSIDTPQRVKVLTYNVRSMMGPDKHRPTDADFDRVVRAIKAENPDIVLLQETSTFGAATNFEDQISKLASMLHPNSVASAASQERSTGSTDENVILTFNGFGISDARGIRLPKSGHTDRGVVDAMVVTPSGDPIRVMSAHLSFDKAYANELEALSKELAVSTYTPTILGGDFNQTTDEPLGKKENAAFGSLGLFDALLANGRIDRNTTTFPSRKGADIDRIYGSHMRPVDANVVTSADNVSDHRPVTAEFELLSH